MNRTLLDWLYTRFYHSSANTWQQQSKLIANDGKPGDTLGGNLAIYGKVAVVGAIGHDQNGENAGAAYVFENRGSKWQQQAKLMASDSKQGAAFGQSIAVNEDTIVIGAPHDNTKGKSSGAVYIFSRTSEGWQQQAKLIAKDTAAGDVFGISVAISGTTVLVGADLNDEKANNAGAAYVFIRTKSGWRQQAKLMANDGGDTDIFGVRVALSGDTALISARRDDHGAKGVDSGSTYIFTRSAKTWRQQAKLIAPDAKADDRFGRDVALVGDTAVIGAMHRDEKGENAGAAYLYTRSHNLWKFTDKLIADDGAAGDLFGWSIGLSENSAVIGTPRNDDAGSESGSAYIFDLSAEDN